MSRRRFISALRQREQLFQKARKAGLLTDAEASKAIEALRKLARVADQADIAKELHDTAQWLKGRNSATPKVVLTPAQAPPPTLQLTKAAPKPPSPAVRDLADRVRFMLGIRGVRL